MAVGPAIGLVVITSLFFNLEFRTWYGGAVKNAVVNSNIVARDYENEIQAELISDTQLIMREIVKVSKNNVSINNQSLPVSNNSNSISEISQDSIKNYSSNKDK